jgi:hypothetical protein
MRMNYTNVRLGFAAVALMVLGISAYSYTTAGNGPLVTICHCNPANPQGMTIAVGQASVQAHMNHGDSMGPCPDTQANGTFEKE